VFNIVHNTSIGSKRFIGGFAARGYVQGNKIYDTTDPIAMPGVECMIDNVIRSRNGNTGPCVKGGSKNCLLVGNTFTVPDAVTPGTGRMLQFAEKKVDAASLPVPTTLRLPGPLPNKRRKIFEVQVGSGDDTKEIQRQIDTAASEGEQGNAVVHLPKGKFSLRDTVVVPAGKRIQIVGDGGNEHGSVIEWHGKGSGPGFKLLGPSLATIRDISFSFVLSGADALAIESGRSARWPNFLRSNCLRRQ
jgi:hypothetical protein